MMPHDPSTCESCRWLAEREGYKRQVVREGIGYRAGQKLGPWIKANMSCVSAATGFCPSLDAVAGLMKELGERDLGCLGYYNGSWCWFWPEEWPGPEPEPEWWWKGMHGPEPIETEDYSCVIGAAMRVLGDKESDD